MMRALLGEYLPWLLSVVTIVLNWKLGSKARNGWAFGLAVQSVWFVWIWASKTWGLLPLTTALTFIFARNHYAWREEKGNALPVLKARSVDFGWVVGDSTGTLYRTMDSGCHEWTPDLQKAVVFMRRADAELWAEEDEDAWRITRHAILINDAEREARRVAVMREDIEAHIAALPPRAAGYVRRERGY